MLTPQPSDRLISLRLNKRPSRASYLFRLPATARSLDRDHCCDQGRMVPRTAESDTAKVLARDGPMKETRSELIFFMVTNFLLWRRGGTLHKVVSSCQVSSTASNGPEMDQTSPSAKVIKTITLGNAVEREHKNARIMPLGHCSTNIRIPLLTRLLKKMRNASTGSQHDQNIFNHFKFVPIRCRGLDG